MPLSAYLPLIAKSAGVTIGAWLCAGVASISIGTLLGVASCHRLGRFIPGFFIRIYTFIAKGIPAYVQILIAYFVLPALFGVHIYGFVAATGALAFCSSGYVTEIVRAGINSIALGQWEACFVLGYPLRATLTRIIIPQAMRNALPAVSGELEQLLKSTSLLATIGVTEITRVGMNIISRELNPVPVYCMIALIYLFLSGLLSLLSRSIERKMHHGNY